MYLLELSHLESVRVSGADAREFLQGQVTCDLRQLSTEQALCGAVCNLKGRVLADFIALQDGHGIVLLTCAGGSQIISDTLKRYAVFSKVEIEAGAIDDSTALGLFGEQTPARLHEALASMPDNNYGVSDLDQGQLLRLPGPVPRFLLRCLDQEVRQQVRAQLGGDPASQADWAVQDFLAGIIHVDPALSERYTPQLLNYDIAGTVNFKKGCYTGQEVVARMYFRGTAKKRMGLLRADAPVSADTEVQWQGPEGEQSVEILGWVNGGQVFPDQHLLLVVASTESLSGAIAGNFRLVGQTEAPLQRMPLPYVEQ